MKQHKVNIRPQTTILSVLKFLEYETWFALAEFVDNAIASYQLYEKDLKVIHGKDFQLEVKIEINDAENKITIRDNAAGIHEEDYDRAFMAAEAPPDTTGLSEFGMGMKSAACWFSDEWTVRTKALGETMEKTVHFNMKKIFEKKIEELEVDTKQADKKNHYTIIELTNVNKMPRRRGLGKVKDHLKSIYREFIRKEILILKVDNEELKYQEPKVLNAPKWSEPKGEIVEWRKEINFPVQDGLSVHGFVAIREKASTSEAGFALFRRGRVIEGSFDNGFRPEYIFGNPNSFRYQRVFGELHLEGFEVIFTKKGIKWDENLEVFLQCLREELEHKDFPLLQQAEKYRVRATEKEYKAAKKALDETVDELEKKVPEALTELREKSVAPIEKEELIKTDKKIHRDFEVRFNKVTWKISIELSYDPSLKEMIEVGDHLINEKLKNTSVRQVGIRLSLTHPFMIEFAGIDNNKIEPILRIAAAFGLSEILARESGAKSQLEVRRNFNELINYLSNPE
ncbi:MAG: ATP-binding protein [Chitinophagaceae bacterium]|nr:ATP-binding protein [Chitinophagaceae bacterium]